MNQILVTNIDSKNGNIVLKNKFIFLPVFIIFILFFIIISYSIYATNTVDNTLDLDALFNKYSTISLSNNVDSSNLLENVILSNAINFETIEDVSNDNVITNTNTTSSTNTQNTISNTNTSYSVIATLNIPSLGINYPVLSETSDELLKISLNKYWGGDPNEIGNFCIVGHNYKNKTHFGKLSQISNGAIVYLTDNSGRTLTYKVYNTYTIDPYDTSCTSQLTNGKKEVTLITCIEHGTKRFVVKAREI